MNTRIRTETRCGPALVAALALLGCGTAPAEPPVDGGDAGTAHDAAVADARPDGQVHGFGCSADLRTVLDVNGNFLATCPEDQGCLEGDCVPACLAAAGSHGNVGCDFWVATPPTYPAVLPPCFAVFVTNTWPRPAHLTVTLDGSSLDVTTFARMPTTGADANACPPMPATGLPADQVAVLFLSSDPASVMGETGEPLSCPVTPAVNASTALGASGTGSAFHLTSDTPVSAYDIMPYGGAPSYFPSASLLLPTSAWGQEYVVINAPPGTHSEPGPLWIQVLALNEGTTVSVRPTVDLPAGGAAPAAPAGTTTTAILAAGQYAQWQLPSGVLDLSGTLLSADREVAVFAGNRFLRLQPTPERGGDATHQQLIPVSALGHEYVAAPYETRRADLQPELIPYRFVGAFDGTLLVFDPPVPGAPLTLERGQVADFQTTLAFRVTSQDESHPFAAAQLMVTAFLEGGTRPGATDPNYPPGLGDEEFVVMFSPAQFLSRYVFFTDPTYLGADPCCTSSTCRGRGSSSSRPNPPSTIRLPGDRPPEARAYTPKECRARASGFDHRLFPDSGLQAPPHPVPVQLLTPPSPATVPRNRFRPRPACPGRGRGPSGTRRPAPG
jgi:hypothetical protein